MPTCTPDGLADSVACLKEWNSQALLAAMVSLLCDLNGMECDADTLDEAAKCLKGVPQQTLWAMAVYLLCNLTNGGGATNYILDGAADPSSDPSDTAENWLYVNTTTGTLWTWPGGGSAWVQRV